ncbi:MAG: calcium-binding protein [Candidatus Accumulibacter necessarius]
MAIYNGTPGNDTLTGSAGSVNDTLNGGLGNDLYRYVLGSGNDVITDTGGLDTLQVGDPNHLYTRWTVYRSGNDLVFDFDAPGRVTITDQFVAAPIVETLRFDDDSSSFSIANSPLGTPGNDLLIGGPAAENIDGGAGDDIIFANEGDDTISGGDGDDEINAGLGANVIDGGGGDDSLSYSFAPGGITVNLSGITQNIAGHGALLDGHVLLWDGLTENIVSGIEEVEGSGFADVFFGGSAGFLTFSGRGGDDWFYGGTDANSSMLVGYWDVPARVIVNLSGAVITVGGTPVASMTAVDGQGGIDHFVLSAGPAAGHVEVSGSRFNDYLRGSDTGNVGLWGGAGNDTIVGGAGLGAAGFYADDSSTYGAIVNLSAASLTVSAAAGVTGVTSDVTVAANQARDPDGNTDTLINIENAYGSEFNDYLLGSVGSNWLSGNEGNDTLDGGAGSDNLVGDEGNDFLQGGAGSDTLDAGRGVDVADGGTDSDTLFVHGNFAAYLRSRPTATDTRLFNALTGEDITFRNVESVNFQDGNKSLADVQSGVGIGNNDSLVGTPGDDTLDGLAGVDTLVGLEANDTYVVDVAADVITESENQGIDRVNVKFAVGGTYILANHVEHGAVVNATGGVNLTGNALSNNLQGNDQANTLSGLDGNDSLSGLAGNDSLGGGAGNDTLDGGAGVDTLVGGIGNDTYVVDAADVITESENQGIDWVNVLLPAPATYILVGNVENAWIGNATAGLNLTGNGLNNTLQGNGQANILSGLDGNDGLYGGAGNDTLLGGAGSDFLAGGGGNDSIDGGVIADRINYTDGNTVSYASANAAVRVDLGTGTASDGLGGTDTLANIFYVQGSAQNDTLLGSAALTLEIFEGGAGDDSIDGGAITDTLNNENANRVSYQNASGPVTVTLTFSGGTLAGSATGADGNDTLFNINQVRGSSHNDSLTGSDNTELVEQFEGRGGADTIDGAGGLDLVRYDNAAAGVNVDLGVGSASDGDLGTDTLSNIEGARGSRHDDTLTGGNAASVALEFFMGLGGDDTIDGGSGYDRAEYHLSTAGVNVTLGGAGNGSATGDISVGTDTLIRIEGVRGSAFNDTLTGSDAADIFESFEGREGNDQIDGKGGVDRVDYQNSKAGVTVTLANAGAVGTAGDGYGGTDTLKNIENVRGSRDFNDNLVGNDSDNLLEGLGGNDTLSGGLGNDSLLGGLGNDTLIGGTGDDTLQGNEGNDLYLVDSALDVVTEAAGQGLDRVDTALASYTLSADVENLTYTGGSAFAGTGNAVNNSLVGAAGNDSLSGLAGDDTLIGNAGNDTLNGGADQDSLVGGFGDDVYVVDSGVSGVDVVSEGAGQGLDRVETALASYTLGAEVENLTYTGASVFSGTGNAVHNNLTGGAGDDTLSGLDGNDTLIGNDGNDALNGGAGNDSLVGGADNDTLDGGAGNDSLVGGAGNDTLNGGAGVDTLVGGLGDDSYMVGEVGDIVLENPIQNEGYDSVTVGLAGPGTYTLTANVEEAWLSATAGVSLVGNDVDNLLAGNGAANNLAGLEGDDLLLGGAGNDTLDGGVDDDYLYGDTGNDSLLGGDGNDELDGGDGSDTLDGGQGDDTLLGDTGNDSLLARDGNDELDGGDGNDTLDGGTGDDSLLGGLGNDTLIGGTGDDTLQGNEGNDLYLVDSALDVVTEAAGQGLDRVDTALASYTLSADVENLTYTGGSAFAGTGNAVNNSLVGAAGNDSLSGLAGDDTLIGNAGNDTLNGGADQDSLVGGFGDDVYVVDSGVSGVDVVSEGAGQGLDRVETALASYTLGAEVENLTYTGASVFSGTGNAVHNNLTGGAGDDTLSGLDGNDTLIGNDGNDALNGGAGNDSLVGGAGNDTLNGGAGVDTLVGGLGNDTYVVDAADVITEIENQGIDWVNVLLPAPATYILVGNVENAWIGNATAGLNLTGNGLNNTLQGNGQANILSGLDGNDGLYGGAGNDTLLGGAGSDFLAGGGGNDSIDGGVIADRINYTDGNTVSYASANAAVRVDLGTGTASDGLGGTDTLANIFYVQGSAQNDTLLGSAALTLEIFEGGAGDDSIDGGAITDTLNNENANRVSYQNASGPVTVTLTFSGGTLAGSATGADGNDTLFNINQVRGSSHNDSLTGSDNTELVEQFEGRGGADTIDGAGGLDLVRYDNAAAGVNVDLGVGSASDGDLGTDTLSNIEGARGSRHDDTLTGGNAASVALEFFMGLGGDDTIDGGSGYDRAEYHLSTAGVNVTLGGAGNGSATGDISVGTDTLIRIEGVRGSAFNDTLTGSDAADIFESFEGREGNDQIDGKGGVDRVDYQNSKAGVTVTLANAGAVGTAGDGYGGTDTLKNIENVRGSRDFNDNLVGNDSDNLLEGLGGNDTLSGGLGNDSLLGGLGNDTLIGGTGDDTLQGNEGNDLYLVDSALDVVTEAAGQGLDRVDTALASYTLSADVENLTYTGGSAFAGTGNAVNNSLVGAAGNDSLSGLAGDDTLIGNAGNDTLNGGADQDSLVGGFGDDVYVVDSGVSGVDVVSEGAGQGLDRVETALASYTLGAEVENLTYTGASVFSGTGNAVHNNLTGGAGDDTLSGLDGNDTLIGNDGNDALNGGAGNDSLVGGADNDTLDGGAGNDSLVGGAGNDTLNGGAGVDTLVGGLGDDSYMVGEVGDIVLENPIQNEGYDSVTVGLAGPGTYTLTANVEEAWLSATAGVSLVGNDVDNLLAGNGAANNLAGLEGDDLLLGGAGNDTLDGGVDDDYLYGDTGNDSLLGGDGNDELDGGDGADTLDGGADDDYLYGDTGNDSLLGGVGNDELEGGDGADTLNGGLGNDELYGDAGNDSLLAGDGDDELDGGDGTDTLDGGLGNDYLYGDTGNDSLLAGDGDDELDGGDGTDTLDGGLGNDYLYGDTGNDSMRGGAGSDELEGGDGTDTLDGGLGDDTLYGDTGNDTLLAGDGNDWLDAGTGVDLADGGADSDTLVVLGDFADYIITRLNETDTRVLNKNLAANEDIVLRGIEYIEFDDGVKTRSEYWNNVIDNLSNDWTGTADDDSVNGLAGNDTLIGNDGDDALDGGLGNDSLVGGLGKDTLIGGTGADLLIGGTGDDTYEIDVAGDVIVEQNAEGTDQVNIAFAASGSYTLVAHLEHATVTAAAAIAVNVTGNELNNRLTGNAAANILSGAAGNDTLIGGAGSDTLVGGSGDDEYQIDVASDVVTEALNEGDDLVNIAFTSTGSYTLTANVENALVTSPGDSFAVNVTGNALANRLTGHAGSNSLVGFDGNDTLDGGGGNDTLDGGIGSDTAILQGVLIDYAISRPSTTQTRFTHLPSGNTILISNVEFITFAGDASTPTLAELIARIGSPGNDTLTGTGGDDTLAGVLGNDSLIGGAGNDDLQGGDGIDTLAGGAGNDLLDGGAGNDTYQFAIAGGDDIIDQNDPLAGSIDTIELASPIGDLISGETTLTRGWHSYDDLVITVNSGSVGAEVVDHLIVSNFLTNDLINLGTIDQIRFLSNSSVLTQNQILAELLKGTGGDDWLRGYANTNDSIAGGAGNDTLGGAAGNDTLSGGLGNDSLSGDAGADVLDGGAGADQVFGGDGHDTLSGSGGNDTLSGDAGNDTYVFGPGFGQDVIQDFGAVGEVDTLKFNVGIRPADVAVARAGNDLVVSFAGAPGDGVRISDFFDDAFSDLGFNRQIEQFAFADGSIWSATAIRAKVLVPTSGDDEITGYLGSESLSGLAGDDTIAGGAGNDTLSGGDGTDRLTGGLGIDRFVFDTADALVHDLITDFVSGVDRIALKGSVFTGLGAVGDTVGLSDHLTYDNGTGNLAYDKDGAGVGNPAVIFAVLGEVTHPATLGLDFLIV